MSIEEMKEVNDLVILLKDGAEFYKEAESKVSKVELKQTFEEMAAIKEQLVNRLQPLIVMQKGQPEESHNIAIQIRKMYTKILASMQKDNAETIIKNLEEVEDKTLDKANEALACAQSVNVADALGYAVPYIENCHQRMSNLKSVYVS